MMAFTIPQTIPARPGSATPGERKVFLALRDHLPEDYLVYYDTSLKGRYPDFMIVGPDLGLVVLEVKDWRLDSIAAVTGDGVVLRQAERKLPVKNPIKQARASAQTIVDALKARPVLSDGQTLCCGWGYGVVFPLLRKKDVETPSSFGRGLEESLGSGLVLTGDDLTADRLLPRLRNLIREGATERETLNPLQVDEIRGVLYPEIRVGLGPADEEILRVMDREQECLARTLGEGHSLVRGVVGSGKTVTVVCRARHLRERHPEWRILVLCFNRVLADYLRGAIGPAGRVEVLHFHRWCWRELEAAGLGIPEPPPPGERSDYWDRELPQLLLKVYDEGRVRPGGYQAILVDEGQDFTEDWYRAVLRALDPETNSLFITLDASQSIYGRKVGWEDLGIRTKGRTRILLSNYRNTEEIRADAYSVIRELDAAEYVVPDQALGHGPRPEVRRFDSPEASRRDALEWIRARLARGVAAEEILVLGLIRPEMVRLETWLEDNGVPAQLLGGKGRPGVVRLSTIHGAKGLDAEAVLLLGAEQLQRLDEAQARRLLYIAMTRARRELYLSYSGDSALMAQLAESG